MALMGLDLGTTGVKSTITDNEGNILSAAYREYETSVPREGEYELDPSVVWSATKEVIQESKKFVKEDVLAVSVSSFGESFVAVDAQGQPLMNTMLQTDSRGKDELNDLLTRISAEEIRNKTGLNPAVTFAVPKIMWISLETDKVNYTVPDFGEITLNGTPESLMGTEGSAMLIPQQLTAWDAAGDKPNANKGAYLAVKLQITTKAGARVYPAEVVGNYDWAAVPVDTNWEAGKKYVYTLDFTSGAGKVDPEKEDPSDPTDPFKPGDDILGNNAIKFTVQVTEWVEETKDVDM